MLSFCGSLRKQQAFDPGRQAIPDVRSRLALRPATLQVPTKDLANVSRDWKCISSRAMTHCVDTICEEYTLEPPFLKLEIMSQVVITHLRKNESLFIDTLSDFVGRFGLR